MNKYIVLQCLFSVLMIAAFLGKGQGVLFCTFMIIVSIYNVGFWLSNDIKNTRGAK